MDETAARAAARPASAPAAGAEEAARVLRRLGRIEALDRERAPSGQLLGELRELVHEAEAWARSRPSDAGEVPDAGAAPHAEATASAAGPSALPTADRKVGEEAEGMR